jgi:hypothetical protein
MPQIKATPFFNPGCSLRQCEARMDITDDLPDATVGECVGEALRNANEAGYDPFVPGFSVLVEFSE